MQPSDKPKFLEVLAGVHDFYGKELSSFAGQVWWQAMAGFDLEQATKALSAHLMDADRGQFMPKPADIVRQLQGTHADRSLVAWGKVLEAMRRVGAYQSVAFDDPAIHAAIMDMGGWPTVCRSEIDDLPFLQKRFCDLHRVFAQRASGGYLGHLAGEYEAINGLKGSRVEPPVLVGDEKRARLVMAGGSAEGRVQITAAGDVARLGMQRGEAA
jgi:hypothetical protein